MERKKQKETKINDISEKLDKLITLMETQVKSNLNSKEILKKTKKKHL